MALAYVFWHWPDHADGYEDRIRAFHAALGRPDTATFRLGRAPFDADEAPYEDWYPVDDWAGVGALNDVAVTGARRPSHDAVAAQSRKGAGAIYERLGDGPPLAAVRFAAWTDTRPEGVEGVWRRQLVLGPAPEYAVLAASPVAVPDGAILTAPALVARA